MKYENEVKKIYETINRTNNFVSLIQHNDFIFRPALDGLTSAGKNLKLGFSCYGLKYYFMTGLWDELASEKQQDWIKYINDFQSSYKNFPENSFIDYQYLKYFEELDLINFVKDLIKNSSTFFGIKNFDSKKTTLLKSINAETKQSVATLFQVGYENQKKLTPEFNDNQLIKYLDLLDWSKPWASGAQFASYCVYAATQNTYSTENLIKYSNLLVNEDDGFYYKTKPSSIRELFNGAMKIISGLDWLNHEIHHPKKIIDFCLINKPIYEGCDMVDFIYVLNKCSNQVNYRKKEVNDLLLEMSREMDLLFHEKQGSYSYFLEKSQTHYYGVKITEGLNTPDLHGTILCTWGNIMILDSLGEKSEELKILKP